MYDKVINTMFHEIQTVSEAGAITATVILVFVCLDAMSYLGMPTAQKEQNRKDFIKWVNKYLKTDCSQPYQYNGNDFYAARCAQLHSFSVFSEFGEKNNCKKFGYLDGGEHKFDPLVSQELILIGTKKLIFDFYSAVNVFFTEAINDPILRTNIESRIHKLNQLFSIREQLGDAK